MSQRRSERDEWDTHKDEIYKLYIEDNRTLSEVAALMNVRYSFKRTKSQYEKIVKKWGMKKYETKGDWRFIAARVKSRKTKGRESEVKIRGALIPMPKVKKQISRYEYLSEPYQRPICNRGLTPPHISIYTPACSPGPISTMLTSSSYRSEPVQWPSSVNMFMTWAKSTPCHQFTQFTQMHKAQDLAIKHSKQYDAGNHESMDNLYSGDPEPMNYSHRRQVATTHAWIEDIRMSSWVKLDPPIPDIYTTLGSYLPPTSDGIVDVCVEDLFDISRGSTQLECIKLAINLISNNHDTWRVIRVIMELLRDKSNLLTLKDLLKQGLLVAEAVAEKLLIPAARDQNFPLLKVVVENGLNFDFTGPGYSDENVLVCAIHNNDEDMVTYLLDYDANATKRPLLGNQYSYESVLNLAVEKGNINIVKDILTIRSSRSCCPNITRSTVRLAILLGNIPIMNLLINRNPSLLQKIKSMPWLFSEAAATHATLSVITHLQNWGVDITASSNLGTGSALAVAAYHANIPLIHQLLDLGADINALAWGCNKPTGLNYVSRLESSKFYAMRNMSALHLAIQSNHGEVVRLLLDRGANPNLLCGYYPIQLASGRGQNAVVKWLLQAGANINSGPDTRTGDYRPYVHDYDADIDQPPIQRALEEGHESVFLTLIVGGAILPSGYSEAAARGAKWNPLQSAIIGGNQKLVNFIIENTGHNHWGTPDCLDYCVGILGGTFAMTLIERRVFSSEALHDPQLLCKLVFENEVDLVKSLVSSTKSNLGVLPPEYGAAGMALAVRLREDTIIKVFLDAGVKPYDLTIDMQHRWDPDLDYNYLRYGHRNGTSPLLEAFILPDIGNSQVRESCDLWNPKVLMEKCGEVLRDTKNIAENRGILFAYGAAISTGRLDMLRIILDSGFDLREIDKTIGFGASGEPLCSSLQCLFLELSVGVRDPDTSHLHEVAMALLKHGASPDCPAEGGFSAHNHRLSTYNPGFNTPLQYAAKLNMASLVRTLLDMGADVNAEPNFHRGATALQFAAINGNFEILNILLEAGADINTLPAGHHGRSALEGASENGRLDMVAYLLEAGANVQGRANKTYRKSVYRACKEGHRCLARKIQDWKSEKYGSGDCEDIDWIMMTMTKDELDFVDIDAQVRVESYTSRDSTSSV